MGGFAVGEQKVGTTSDGRAVAAVPATTLRVIAADGEPTALRRLTRLLADVADVNLVTACRSGREALDAVRTRSPDVLFLDTEIPDLDGLSVARELAEPGFGTAATPRPLVVFVTACDGHALDAFQVHAADYLLKPIDRTRLRQAVDHARQRVAEARAARGGTPLRPRLSLQSGRCMQYVNAADVLWIESFGNYTRVHTRHGRFLHRSTTEHLSAELAEHGFVRVHRTMIVNTACITRLRPIGSGQYEAVLDSGDRLRVSRTYRQALDGLGVLRPPDAHARRAAR